MSKTRIIVFLIFYFALWLSPAIIAHRRQHPQRLAISIITLLLGLASPIALACLIWACWPTRCRADLPQPNSSEPAHPSFDDLPEPSRNQTQTTAEESRQKSFRSSDYYSDE